MRIPWAVPNIQKVDIDAVTKVLNSGWLTMGKEAKKFEKAVSSYLNTSYAVAVNNGTAALDVAMKCLNITRGDEVIVPALSYIATGNAIVYNQGTPVFVDIDDTLNIDTSLIEEKISDKTKAIMNIDLGGNVSNYTELLRISRQYDIPLIVDGAQSFGSEYQGRKCCTHGIINTTSFHAAKILTTVEGGMVITDKKEFFQKAQLIRNQGDASKYIHSCLGNNYRMVDLLAAMGNSQLRRFEKTLEERKEKVQYYKEQLKNIRFPRELEKTKNCYFFFLILVEQRDKLSAFFGEEWN